MSADPTPGRRLVIISDTPHYRTDEGVVAWASTTREIDVLAGMFSEVTHVTPLYASDERAFATRPYRAANVRLHFVDQAGGDGLRAKLGIVASMRGWARALRQEVDRDALVHLRAPASLSMFALVWLVIHRRPVHWAKYAGNWRPTGHEPLSYRVQRLMLLKLLRTPVTVNGTWPGDPARVRAFVNPAFTDAEVDTWAAAAAEKHLGATVRILFVGRLDPTKGPQRVIEAVRLLVERGVDAHLDLVGDGAMADDLPGLVAAAGLDDRATLHGWLGADDLRPLYASAHVFMLPTESEGFPKVVSEAMAHGAVPIVGAVSSIPSVLGAAGAGHCVDPMDPRAFADAAEKLTADPTGWEAERDACTTAAHRFAFEAYLADVRRLFAEAWSVDLPGVAPPPG